jgi:L-aspartate semialdehyde sulfurtransferase ferredoxin
MDRAAGSRSRATSTSRENDRAAFRIPASRDRRGMRASIGASRQEAPTLKRQRLKLTFPEPLIQEPIIYSLAKRFDVVTNIRRADIRETTGWVLLEVTGTEQRLDEARRHLEGIGVRVDDLETYVE